MKSSRRRSILVLFLVLAFLSGGVFFTAELSMNAGLWALRPFNEHLSLNSLADAGKIYDRNSIILAQSLNGKRVYNEDVNVRRAMLHVIGDEEFNISTSVQSKIRDQLFGYNYLTGIDTPWFMRKVNDVTLTLDSEISKSALSKFEGKKGAAVFLNYKTGEIICMISSPTYDINDPPNIKADEKKYDGIYLNKALSGTYAPGSVFKVITAICAAENMQSVDSVMFDCSGEEIIEGEKITCMGNHGHIGLKDGLKNSCNIVLGKFALKLGKDRMTKTTQSLGFSKPIPVSFTETEPSNYDVSSASSGSLAWSGIGQFNNTLNPLHMAIILGAVANDGVSAPVKMIKEDFKNFLGNNSESKRYMSSKTASKIKDYLSYTIKNGNISHLFEGLDICGKTGTAEVGENKKPHAWMVGFLNDEKHPYSFAVVVENSGFGGKNAAPVASFVLKKLAIL